LVYREVESRKEDQIFRERKEFSSTEKECKKEERQVQGKESKQKEL
jgi:hypothetical protein